MAGGAAGVGVENFALVEGHDEREGASGEASGGERGEGGEGVVGVDEIEGGGAETAGDGGDGAQVVGARGAAVDEGDLDLEVERAEGVGLLADEDAVVGRRGGGEHVRDEEDAEGGGGHCPVAGEVGSGAGA